MKVNKFFPFDSQLAMKDTNKAKEYFQKCVDLKIEGAGTKVQEGNIKVAKERVAALSSSWW
jgi:hypothetical protein